VLEVIEKYPEFEYITSQKKLVEGSMGRERLYLKPGLAEK
jgi:hypothetical protein